MVLLEKKKNVKNKNSYDAEELEALGIFLDNDNENIELEDK